MNEREEWMTKREVAAKLKLSTRTVERLRLPFVRVGGQNRYFMNEVERDLRHGHTTKENNVVQLHPRNPKDAA